MAALRALAFILQAAVFLVGVGRSRSYLAPPDVVWVGLLLGTPLVTAATLVLGYRLPPSREPMPTLTAMTCMLSGVVVLFALRLLAGLPAATRAEQALWIAILLVAPLVGAGVTLAVRRNAS